MGAPGMDRSLRGALLCLVALVLLACAGNCGGLVPNCVEECANEGECGRRWYRSGDAAARCYIRDDADCEHSTACTEGGRCHFLPDLDDDRCVAATDLDCRESEGCADRGACAVNRDGECRVESSGCQRSDACQDEGRCEYAISERCVEGEVNCDEACRMEGACTLVNGVCVATSDEDCADSHFCRYEGQCALNGDRCVSNEAGCATNSMCEMNRGLQPNMPDRWCSYHPDADWCWDGATACDMVCFERGDCSFIDGVCQAGSDADCEGSLACIVQGRCSTPGGEGALCGALSNTDCEGSLECAAFGRCLSNGYTCWNGTDRNMGSLSGCSRDPECKTLGRCLTADDGSCVTPEEVGLPPWTPTPPW